MAKSEDSLTLKDLNLGCVVTEPGNARQYKTGSWKSKRPVTDREKCNKCGLCYIYCPEGCIRVNNEGYFLSNYEYCKGCGICAHECPQEAITMIEEEEE